MSSSAQMRFSASPSLRRVQIVEGNVIAVGARTAHQNLRLETVIRRQRERGAQSSSRAYSDEKRASGDVTTSGSVRMPNGRHIGCCRAEVPEPVTNALTDSLAASDCRGRVR